jgi:hypothetical protein
MMIGRSAVGAAGSGTMVGPYLGSGGKYQTVPGLCGAPISPINRFRRISNGRDQSRLG